MMNMIKLLSSFACTLLLLESSDVFAKENLKSGPEGKGPEGKRPRGGFEAHKPAGRLQLCPTGDCKQSMMEIAMERLIEVDAQGSLTTNKAKNFQTMEYGWSTPVSALNEQGVNVTTSNFDSIISVENGSVTKNVTYKAYAAFYATNGTALNGKQVIDVPAGGLKFAVWIENWPFLNDANKLRLGLRVMTRNKKGEQKPRGEKDPKRRGRDRLIERLNLGDSMFLDSPVLAEVDHEMKNISTFTQTHEEGFVMVEYEFPKFTTLYYDPVMSSEEEIDQVSSTTKSAASTTTTGTSTSVMAGAALVSSILLYMF